ncbi:HIT domain-containing protein [Thermoproteota archaeon]
MNKLWAPWRIKFIQQPKRKGCIICNIAKNKKLDTKHYVILRSKNAFSLLNLYPYNNGHVMVCPKRHVATLEKLNNQEAKELFEATKKTKRLLDRVLKPDGYNIGMNLGEVSGAGIPKHIHLHIVPRWKGDTNFMPILGNTKVISQSLKELYRQLTKSR